MARKICTAGVVGSYSFMVLDQDRSGDVVSVIKGEYDEILTRHPDVNIATEWTERKLRELIGKRYEADGI